MTTDSKRVPPNSHLSIPVALAVAALFGSLLYVLAARNSVPPAPSDTWTGELGAYMTEARAIKRQLAREKARRLASSQEGLRQAEASAAQGPNLAHRLMVEKTTTQALTVEVLEVRTSRDVRTGGALVFLRESEPLKVTFEVTNAGFEPVNGAIQVVVPASLDVDQLHWAGAECADLGTYFQCQEDRPFGPWEVHKPTLEFTFARSARGQQEWSRLRRQSGTIGRILIMSRAGLPVSPKVMIQGINREIFVHHADTRRQGERFVMNVEEANTSFKQHQEAERRRRQQR